MGKQLQTCTAIALGLALAAAPLRAAHSAPPKPAANEAAIPLELVLDTSVLDPDLGARLDRKLGDQLEPELAQVGLQLVEADTSDGLVLKVRFLSFDADERNYSIELEIRGDAGPAQAQTFECEACSERRLVGMVVDIVPRLVAQYEASKEEVELPPEDPEPVGVVDDGADRELRLGALGISGAALGGVGVAVAIAGSYLLGVKAPELDPRTAVTADGSVRTFNAEGGAMLGLGVVALGAGIALLVIDLRERNPKRRLSAQISTDYLGLSFQQRF